MGIILASKAPNERLAYIWTPALVSGDTITGSLTISAVSGTASVDAFSLVGTTQVKIFVTGGALGETSEFLCQVNTLGGETLQETLYLPIKTTGFTALAAKLVQAFPAFAKVNNAAISYWLGQAEDAASWGSDHTKMLLACHNMAINGLGDNPVADGLLSFKSGSVDMKFSDKKAGLTGFEQTTYGMQYSAILRKQFAGPMIVNTGLLAY